MASERALKPSIVVAALVLALLGGCTNAAIGSPRLLVLCAIAALLAAALLWRSLARLAPRAPRQVAETALPAREQQRLLDAALALEAQLQHAPIALFRISGGGIGGGIGTGIGNGIGSDGDGDSSSSAGVVVPLNANARRLVAPGRASAPADLYRQLGAQPVDQRSLIAFDTERGVERALVAVSALTLQGEAQRLVALMPVESQLEAEALNAWRQLVQVLTHEIMNSLTPVASLSRTAHDLLDELRGALPPDVSGDLSTALDAIARRAASLVEFVASYRSLSTVPQAQPERVVLSDLFARLAALLGPEWQARGGRAEFSVEPQSLEVMVDAGQLEQALINLLKNAAEATAGMAAPLATVSARLSRGGRLRIDIADNGAGVPESMAAHIFTPFFSTKKQGRGIGLAMVRHLVHANGGTVRYARSVAAGARFVVTF